MISPKEWGRTRQAKFPALRRRIPKFSESKEIDSIVNNEYLGSDITSTILDSYI
jgi:hypothetical protein